MGQPPSISRPRFEQSSLRAVAGSCVLHGLLVGLIVGLSLLYRAAQPPTRSGSAAPTVMSLETVVVTSTTQPAPPPPTPVVQAPAPLSPPMPRQPVALSKLPEEGVPVLAVQPSKPTPMTPTKTHETDHAAVKNSSITMTQSSPKPARAASLPSQSSSDDNMPDPPYPVEAQDLQETGTVYLNVQFDALGSVVTAKVTQSSGVAILDSEARSFIRAHWHSFTYAGQVVNVPVKYRLANL